MSDTVRQTAAVIALLSALLLSGCSYTHVAPVESDNKSAIGFRYYDPQPMIISTCDSISVVNVPDYSRGYTVTPVALLSKNSTDLNVDNGLLNQVKSDLDATAFLDLIKSLGAEAIKNAGALAALSGAQADIPMAGVWKVSYNDDGELSGLEPIGEMYPCPKKAPAAHGNTDTGAKRE